jgi:hypothetical protein
MLAVSEIPRFEQLPLREGDPPFSAWGMWKNVEHGSLNYLSDEKVLKAARNEIKTGERVSLEYAPRKPRIYPAADICFFSLPLDKINPPLLGRQGFERKIINKAPRVINDDVASPAHRHRQRYLLIFAQITFNTQGSSQWDSFRHFAYQKDEKFYNG